MRRHLPAVKYRFSVGTMHELRDDGLLAGGVRHVSYPGVEMLNVNTPIDVAEQRMVNALLAVPALRRMHRVVRSAWGTPAPSHLLFAAFGRQIADTFDQWRPDQVVFVSNVLDDVLKSRHVALTAFTHTLLTTMKRRAIPKPDRWTRLAACLGQASRDYLRQRPPQAIS